MRKIVRDYIDFWVDESKNIWSCNRYTEDQALNASRNMINCGNCINCWDCINCYSCENLKECVNCTYCENCEKCINCLSCKECKELKNGQDLYFNN